MEILIKLLLDPQGGANQKLHGTQQRVFNSKARFKVLRCGRGWGKTSYCLAEIAKQALVPNSVIWYVGLTEALGMEMMWDRVIAMFPSDFLDGKPAKTEMCISLINGSKIYIKGANNLKNATNLRGRRINLVIFDEAAFMHCDVWGKVLQSAVRRCKGKAVFLSTPHGNNWFKMLCDTKDDDWEVFHFTSYDNPHYPKEEIDAQRDTSKDIEHDYNFRQEVLAEFVDTYGLVYDFNSDIHVCQAERLSGGIFYVGVDIGIVDDTAAIFVRMLSNNRIVVEREYVNNKSSLQGHIDNICSIGAELEIYDGNVWSNTMMALDPVAVKKEITSNTSVLNELRKAGFPIYQGEKKVDLGVSYIKDMLSSKSLTIMPSCKNLIEAFKTWEVGTHEPDTLAALRYGLRMYALKGENININKKSILGIDIQEKKGIIKTGNLSYNNLLSNNIARFEEYDE